MSTRLLAGVRSFAAALFVALIIGCGTGPGAGGSAPTTPAVVLGDPPTSVWVTSEPGWLEGVVGDRVILVDDRGTVTALDLATGGKAWSHDLGAGCAVGPAHVVCLDQLSARAHVFEPATGRETAAVDVGKDVEDLAVNARGFYTRHAAQGGEPGPMALKAWEFGGAPRWTAPGPDGEVADPDSRVDVSGDLVGITLQVWVDGQSSFWQSVYDARDGRELAKNARLTNSDQIIRFENDTTEIMDASGAAIRSVPGWVATRERVPFGPHEVLVTSRNVDAADEVQAVAADGKTLWTTRVDEWSSLHSCDIGIIAAGQVSIARLDPATGQESWHIASPVSPPVVRCLGSLLIVTQGVEGNEETANSLFALDGLTGKEKWFLPAIGSGELSSAGLLVFDLLADRVRLYR